VMLVHHGHKGIVFSEHLPDPCDFLGQSLLFASAFLAEGLRMLGATGNSGQINRLRSPLPVCWNRIWSG
jgi:hypothetical protein